MSAASYNTFSQNLSCSCFPKGDCGQAQHFCQAPDCLLDFGNGCHAHKKPVGRDTSQVERPYLGQVPYGYTPVYHCVTPKTVALTFDDGPYHYTADLLDLLNAFDAKATFFVTGINSNKGPIDDPSYPWLHMIQQIHYSGHQIASHTWSHQNLDLIKPDQRRDQIIKIEMALRNILGGFPTYMRPPYSSCSVDSGCVNDMAQLGYHVVYFDVDTNDYNNATPDRAQLSKDIFDNAMAQHEPTGRPLLVIAHDVHEQTVYNLTAHMLRRLFAADYRAVTLGECLGDHRANWYRFVDDSQYSGGGSQDKPKVAAKPVSLDGFCGVNSTCLGSLFGHCCSGLGYCGHSSDHCGSGCQPTAGTCFPNPGLGINDPAIL